MNLLQTLKKWWDVGTINPERDEAKMPVLLLWVERAAIMVVAVVSGIAVAVFGYMKAADYTSLEIVRWLSAGLMFFLATAITDVGVKYFIQKSAFDFFAAFNPKTYDWEVIEYTKDMGAKVYKRSFKYQDDPKRYVYKYNYNWFQRAMQVVAWVCMVAIVAGLFWFDYVSVDSVRRPVANLVKKETKLNQDSIRRSVDAQEQARIGAVVGAIQSVQLEIKKTERQIEATKQRVYQSEGALRRLFERDNNGWAKGQISAKQSKAVSGLQSQLETLRQNKADLEAQRVKDLAYRSSIIAKTDSSVLAENAAIDGRNTSLVEGTSSLFIWMGFYAKCIAGLIRILLVVMFMGGNVKDYNGDGKIDHTDVNSAAYVGFQMP